MLSITSEALTRLRTILADGDSEGLRVWVEPGGCSGFSYGMGLDNAQDGDETFLLGDEVVVMMDGFTASMLEGAEIDFIDSLMGGGFTIHNPNAISTCSCGSSFATDGDGGAPRGCGARA